MNEESEALDIRRMAANLRLPLIGLLVVQIFIGYEWLISALTKIVRGGFPAGLADDLAEKSEGVPGWYQSFLDSVVIPNGSLFGYLIEIGEALVGVALIGAAIAWLFAWGRMSVAWRSVVLGATAVAALAGIVMTVSFHLANGEASHLWLAKDAFEEGVDLDGLLTLIQATLVAISGGLLLRLRKSARRGVKVATRGRVVPG